jgi:mannose-1-phosphate guanylyltransferase
MCGGEGTRLRPLTFHRPKPCIPIANIPSIVHLVNHLRNLGCTEIVFTLGYLGQEIEALFGDGSVYGVHIEYVHENKKLGTAGSVKNAAKYLSDQPFLVVGGDHLTDIDLCAMYLEHNAANPSALVTIGLITVDDPSEYGIADMGADREIKRFFEKPKPGEIFSNVASTGIYVCSPEIFSYIPDDTKFDFAKNLFPLLMNENHRINGWLARGTWSDVGSPGSLREATTWMIQKQTQNALSAHSGSISISGEVEGPVQITGPITIGKGSRIVGPVIIDAGAMIGENVLIGPYSSIGKNCKIGTGARIFSTALYNDVTVGEHVTVSGSIIDDETTVGSHSIIEYGSIIGFGVTIGRESRLHANVRIWPEYTIADQEQINATCLSDGYNHAYEGS